MTYLYETIQPAEGDTPKRYEIKQSIHDAPLTHHPETGEAIRRVIVGGFGIMTGKSGGGSMPQGGGGCCGHGGCCHG